MEVIAARRTVMSVHLLEAEVAKPTMMLRPRRSKWMLKSMPSWARIPKVLALESGILAAAALL